MQKIAVINQKGGVGKTTTAVNVGAALARMDRKVLLVDLDPQSNLTLHLDRRPEPGAKTMTDVLVDQVPLVEVIVDTRTPMLSVAPSDTALAGVEQVLANHIGRETILSDALDAYPVEQDFALMDCPPSLGVLSANALVAADSVLIPIQTEYFALQGMAKLLEVIQLVRRRLNPKLEICAILPCMVDQRTRLSAEVREEIQRHFGRWLSRSMIRANVKLAEAPSFGMTIFEHAADSNGAQDYADFAEELLGSAFREVPVDETPATEGPANAAQEPAATSAAREGPPEGEQSTTEG